MSEFPLVAATFGPLPAPEVAYNPLDKTFWLTWIWENTRIDVSLKDRAALRELTRFCIAASEQAREYEHEASHTVTNSG